MTLDPDMDDTTLAYMHRWFINRSHLADLCGVEPQEIDTLISAGCAPGIIYSFHEQYGWWSALAAATGNALPLAPAGGKDWYSPGARWWLRRAMLAQRKGKTANQAAKENKKYFCASFTDQMRHISYAQYLFRDADNAAIAIKADEEWQNWINGAFGVCLIHFSAETCIRKGALGHMIKSKSEHMDQENKAELFNLIEELAPFMTPFTPWERPTGTPGLAIDLPLKRLGLGAEYPFRGLKTP
jgi:Family of unknown function (DUF6058)